MEGELKLCVVDFSELLEGLNLEPVEYAPEPEAEGHMPELSHWDKYLAKFMPDVPEGEMIDPKELFFQDRWIFISRAYGKEFCMKLFSTPLIGVVVQSIRGKAVTI